jgi:hypothetical protein
LWTHNITVPPDLVAALDDDDRAKAASESLGRSERYAVILPLLKAKTPQQRTERLRVTMARSCYPDRVRAQLPWSQPFGARQTQVFAERVKQADTRLERHNGVMPLMERLPGTGSGPRVASATASATGSAERRRTCEPPCPEAGSETVTLDARRMPIKGH